MAGIAALIPLTLLAINFADYPSRPAKSYPGALSADGLDVGVDPVHDLDVQKKYFRLTFKIKGYLPVFVVLDNHSSADSFIVNREEIGAFADGDEDTNVTNITSGRSNGGERLMLAGTLALSTAGALVAMHMMVRATEIQDKVIKKELRSITLSPGAGCRGFVYLPVSQTPEEQVLGKCVYE